MPSWVRDHLLLRARPTCFLRAHEGKVRGARKENTLTGTLGNSAPCRWVGQPAGAPGAGLEHRCLRSCKAGLCRAGHLLVCGSGMVLEGLLPSFCQSGFPNSFLGKLWRQLGAGTSLLQGCHHLLGHWLSWDLCQLLTPKSSPVESQPLWGQCAQVKTQFQSPDLPWCELIISDLATSHGCDSKREAHT